MCVCMRRVHKHARCKAVRGFCLGGWQGHKQRRWSCVVIYGKYAMLVLLLQCYCSIHQTPTHPPAYIYRFSKILLILRSVCLVGWCGFEIWNTTNERGLFSDKLRPWIVWSHANIDLNTFPYTFYTQHKFMLVINWMRDTTLWINFVYAKRTRSNRLLAIYFRKKRGGAFN